MIIVGSRYVIPISTLNIATFPITGKYDNTTFAIPLGMTSMPEVGLTTEKLIRLCI